MRRSRIIFISVSVFVALCLLSLLPLLTEITRAADASAPESNAAPAQLYTLSGKVYDGACCQEPPNSQPLYCVLVTLYCNESREGWGTEVVNS
ncbi:MAG TPA: hypothetical protein VM537_21745, partial [Anaerolineae bacterium]|nr:hypothetical protein [Anaerolineae bacterium]